MKNLIKLDEHNANIIGNKWGVMSDEPQLNGIVCPKCNMELYDTYPMIVMTSIPPQKHVNCFACGYTGYRFA